MSGKAGWDRAPWLWWLALAGGISFFTAVLYQAEGPAIWAWKTSGVALLALWAAANARRQAGWMIVAIMALGALGDWLLEAAGMIPGAVAFLAGHAVAIALYLRYRRASLTPSQRLLAILTVPASVAIAWLIVPRADAPGVAVYTVFVSAMAASAWASRFPRYRTGLGAMMFLASDLLIFARIGDALPQSLTHWLIWPLYFGGQALIARGVVSTLAKDAIEGR